MTHQTAIYLVAAWGVLVAVAGAVAAVLGAWYDRA